jgi:hypothetical protein
MANSRQAAEFLVLVLEDWCRRRRFDGDPPLREGLREALELAAVGAPRLAVCFPELMRASPQRPVRALAAAMEGVFAAASLRNAGARPKVSPMVWPASRA